jgi:hypothetical protein
MVVSLQFYQGHSPLKFRLADFPWNRLADFFEAGEIPEIGKLATLLRLHRLDGAILTFEENAFSVRFFQQRQTAPVRAQPRELFDEITLVHAFERRQPHDFRIIQTHLPRPAAAGRAALTFQKNGHQGMVNQRPDLRRKKSCRATGIIYHEHPRFARLAQW